jgi:hypothetical protein
MQIASALQQWANQRAAQSQPTEPKSEAAVALLKKAFCDLPDEDLILAYEVFDNEKMRRRF